MEKPINIETYLPFGVYHVFLIISQHIYLAVALGNMAFMTFGGLKPTLTCSNVANSSELKSDQICEFVKNNTCGNLTKEAAFYSINMEWDLICDDKGIPFIITSVQMAGVLLGAPFFGQLSDMFRRKWVFVGAFSSMLVFGGISSLSPNWQTFMILRFFIGFCVAGSLSVYYVYYSEFIPNKHRVWMLSGTTASVAYIILAWVAYGCGDWKTLSWVNNAYGVPFIIVFAILAIESPRWFISKNRLAEAHESIRSVNKWSCRKFDDGSVRDVVEKEGRAAAAIQEGKKYSFWHLFYSWKLFAYTLTLAFAWFTTSCVSYGILFHAGRMAGSIYMNVTYFGIFRWLVSAAMSILDLIFKKLGRQIIHTFSAGSTTIITGVVLLLILLNFDPSETESIRYLSLVCAALLNPLWAMIYLVPAEVYPTPIRNISNSFCSIFARIGGILAPQVNYLGDFWSPATYLVYCIILAIETVTFFLVLPETKGLPLPEKMPEKEERIFYKKKPRPESQTMNRF